MTDCVIAVVATFKRPAELRRLLQSLAESLHPVQAVIVVDNGGDLDTSKLRDLKIDVRVVVPGRNLGCGGGLRFAESTALRDCTALTHVWILDDDAVVTPESLGELLIALHAETADAAHPLVLDDAGRIGWFPGLLDLRKFKAIRASPTVDAFIAAHSDAPIPFSWCQGIALLVTRRMLDSLGLHRDDYWVRGEDLEFSLRITERHRGIYVPAARVQHSPPAGDPSAGRELEYSKHRAMLQNIAYTGIRLRHGRRIARTLPGNWLRFLRTWGFRPRVLLDSIRAIARGALLGKPAGVE